LGELEAGALKSQLDELCHEIQEYERLRLS
jgi:hypothetical protein